MEKKEKTPFSCVDIARWSQVGCVHGSEVPQERKEWIFITPPPYNSKCTPSLTSIDLEQDHLLRQSCQVHRKGWRDSLQGEGLRREPVHILGLRFEV